MKKRISFPPQAINHLKTVSSEMKALIELIGDIETYSIPDHFTALVSQIVYQSISFKAATTIWERIYDNYAPITPQRVLSIPFDELRAQGLSQSKTKYIYHIADAFLHHTINTNFAEMTDKEIISEVTKIKGVGKWTAEMFLIFSLERPNVISYGDIAIRKGIEWLYDIDHSITEAEFQYYVNLFSPYNTYASHYLWEITIRSYWYQKEHME
jgi:3-methyladenine DNA glycosylase/8-oxoguanine DNA glycosylase